LWTGLLVRVDIADPHSAAGLSVAHPDSFAALPGNDAVDLYAPGLDPGEIDANRLGRYR
jgi:hypothetical protein